jgi:phosphonate transport system permease protein
MGSVAEAEARYCAAAARRRAHAVAAAAAFLLLAGFSFASSGVLSGDLPDGLPRLGRYLMDLAPELAWRTLRVDLARWLWGWPRWLSLLWDTLLMALLGTAAAGAAGLLLSFPAARNLAPSWVTFPLRRGLEAARTIPEAALALIFVFAYGLGPLAGVLALAVHGAGAIGKLCSELNEAARPEALDAARATGAGWLSVARYGAFPQVVSGFLSVLMLRLEINVRQSSVIGFAGAGGIGQELYVAIRQFQYADIGALVLLILLTVMAIDLLSQFLRRRLA